MRSLENFTNIWIETGITLTAVLPFAILAYYYPELTETVPIHWNAVGEPDSWKQKEMGEW